MMKPVVIIGGGPAGIASAAFLAKNGIDVVLIERSARLGGRAASFFYSRMHEEVDYGQHVLMRCCTRSLDLLQLLGEEGSVSFQPRLRVALTDGEKRGIIGSSPLPGVIHLLPSLLSYRFLSLPARLRALQAGLSLLTQDPGDMSFVKWLADHGQGERAIATLWDPICIATLNTRASDASARMARVVFQRGFFRPHGADIGLFTRPLSKIFASAIQFLEGRQGRVLLGASARTIIVEQGRARAVELTNGDVIDASEIISAVSQRDLLALLPSAAAKVPFFDRLREILLSPIVNVHLWFDRQVMDEPFIIGVDSPLQGVFDVSAAHQDPDQHHIVISQSAADSWVDMPVASIVKELLSALRTLLPHVRDAKLIDTLVIKSRQATFIPSPAADRLRPLPITPIEGLFLAGDYTATDWPATIEGAVRSGMIAADTLLAGR